MTQRWCIYGEDIMGRNNNKTPKATKAVLGESYSGFDNRTDAITVLAWWFTDMFDEAHALDAVTTTRLRKTQQIVNEITGTGEVKKAGCRYFVAPCSFEDLPRAITDDDTLTHQEAVVIHFGD